jgi:catechol 2,3-dioxygenase-like lactoylglutathione lyase family enzyme
MNFAYHHVGLSVADLTASISWYERVMGFVVDRRYRIEAIPAEVAEMYRGDLRIELFEVPDAAPMAEDRRHPNRDVRTHGHKHVAYVTPDLKHLVADLTAHGADIVWVKEFPWGSNAFIRDNSGNLIEFVQA